MGSYLLLPGYIFVETSRALVVYALLNSGVRPEATLINFLAEIAKFLFAGFFYWHRFYRISPKGEAPPSLNWRGGVFYAFPAGFYLINNLLYFSALQLSTPILVHVAMMSKLPLTAVLHHYIIRRETSVYSWTSLATLCAGLLIFNLPESSDTVPTSFTLTASAIGPLLGFIIGVISAGAGILTEVLLKTSLDFWVGQIWLYFYGSIFAGASYFLWDGNVAPRKQAALVGQSNYPQFGAVGAILIMIAMTAATGLIVANILRKKDNLVKLVGSSAAIVTVFIAQVIFYPALRRETLTRPAIIGAGATAIGSWTYTFYRNLSNTAPSPIFITEADEARIPLTYEPGSLPGSPDPSRYFELKAPSSPRTTTWDPTPTKVTVAAIGLAILAWSV